MIIVPEKIIGPIENDLDVGSIVWSEGEYKEIPVQWVLIENIAQVADKELVGIEYKLHADGNSFYVDDAFLLKDLTNDKLLGADKTFQLIEGVGTDTIEVPVFGAVQHSEIVGVHIVPKEDITSFRDVQLKMINKATGGIICTLTFSTLDDENIARAYEVRDFGPISKENNLIELGQSVSFVKEGVGHLPNINLIIQYNLA